MRELGDRRGTARALVGLGTVAHEQADYSTAGALLQESLTILRELGDRGVIVPALDGLAAVIASLGSSLRASRIWGSAEQLREEIGSPLAPKDRSLYDQRVGAARAALGDGSAFELAWQEGRALTLEQAIELALAQRVPTV
jgi:hypothetical protein